MDHRISLFIANDMKIIRHDVQVSSDGQWRASGRIALHRPRMLDSMPWAIASSVVAASGRRKTHHLQADRGERTSALSKAARCISRPFFLLPFGMYSPPPFCSAFLDSVAYNLSQFHAISFFRGFLPIHSNCFHPIRKIRWLFAAFLPHFRH